MNNMYILYIHCNSATIFKWCRYYKKRWFVKQPIQKNGGWTRKVCFTSARDSWQLQESKDVFFILYPYKVGPGQQL